MLGLDLELENVRVPNRLVGQFANQLCLMLQSGIGLAGSMEVLRVQKEHQKFGEIVELTAEKVLQGHTLSEAMTYFPRAFPATLRALVQVGEQTGSLPGTLQRAGQWLEQDDELRRKVMTTLTYPVLVCALSLFLTIALFTTIVPQFLGFLATTGVDPPLPTLMVLWISSLMTNPGTYVFVLGLLGFLWLGWRHISASPEELALWVSRLYRTPVIGPVVRLGALTRFSFSGASLLEQGAPLTRALALAGRASGSPLLALDLKRVVEGVKEGESLAALIEARRDIYDTRLVYFVATGEETAKLPFMLSKSGSLFKMDLDLAVEQIPALLEPALLCFVGGMVATVLLSLFLPIYSSLGGL